MVTIQSNRGWAGLRWGGGGQKILSPLFLCMCIGIKYKSIFITQLCEHFSHIFSSLFMYGRLYIIRVKVSLHPAEVNKENVSSN